MGGTMLPPMGPAYIAAYLEKHGSGCDVLDLNILLYSKANSEFKLWWGMEHVHSWTREADFASIRESLSEDIEFWAKYLADRDFSTVGFSISGGNVLFSVELARALKAKRPDVCVVFGGASCNFFHADPRMPFRFMVSLDIHGRVLTEGLVNYFVVGEGEESFLEIVSARKAGRPILRPGIISPEMFSRTELRSPSRIVDLDALPFPAWEKFPISKYDLKGKLPILFARGCINRCAFCNDWSMLNGRFRSRSAGNIFAEMNSMCGRFGKKSFHSNDLLFNGDLKMLDELADLLIASGLGIRWSAQGVVRPDMTLKLLRKLKKAGLVSIVYGVEHLSDKVLRKMHKPFTFAQVQDTLRSTKAADIIVCINLIAGFPGETEEDVSLVIQSLRKIRPYVDAVSSLNPCHITASTELESYPERFGIVFPEGKDRCVEWESADGTNTFSVRKQRAQRVYNCLKELGIKTEFIGLYDGDSPLQKMMPAITLSGLKRRVVSVARCRRLVAAPAVAFILLFHLLIYILFRIIKSVRKTSILPGG